jgi:hypothetical protein
VAKGEGCCEIAAVVCVTADSGVCGASVAATSSGGGVSQGLRRQKDIEPASCTSAGVGGALGGAGAPNHGPLVVPRTS